MKRSLGFLALALAACAPTQVLWSDNFDSNTSASYTVAGTPGFGVDQPDGLGSAETRANFAYDYSVIGSPAIPPAPGGTSTLGLRLTANDATPTGIASIAVFPNAQDFSGDYEFSFWQFSYVREGVTAGTTESALYGINFDPATPWQEFVTASGVNPGSTIFPSGQGFFLTTEGGAARDYRYYETGAEILCNSNPGWWATKDPTLPNFGHDGNNPYFQSVLPPAGVPTNRWFPVRVIHANTPLGRMVQWWVDGLKVMELFEASPVRSSGNVYLGYTDPFGGSIAPQSDVIGVFDNAKVERVAVSYLTVDLTLQGWVATAFPRVRVELRERGTTNVVYRDTGIIENGQIRVFSTLAGEYDLWIKGRRWLAKSVPVSLTGGSATTVAVELPGGDIVESNSVDLDDFLVLAANYELSPPTDVNTDLTGDGVCDLEDFLILAANYETSGAP